jgi:hypothetical protein
MQPEGIQRGDKDPMPYRYSNYFKIGYNREEFLLYFGQLYEGSGNGPMHTRLVTLPVIAKALLSVLAKSVSQYEEKYGTIPADKD